MDEWIYCSLQMEQNLKHWWLGDPDNICIFACNQRTTLGKGPTLSGLLVGLSNEVGKMSVCEEDWVQ